MDFRDIQSEERKSFNPPFLLPWVSSLISILLRRWTTQFFGLEGGLEEDEPDPEVLEEVEDLEGARVMERVVGWQEILKVCCQQVYDLVSMDTNTYLPIQLVPDLLLLMLNK